MNDLESKLRSLTFREPPPGWRGSIIGVSAPPRNRLAWLAPHPAAWAALAAIWMLLGPVSQMMDKPAASAPAAAVSRSVDHYSETTLFAFQLRAAPGLEPPL